MATKSETQAYKLIQTESEFEIRCYPMVTLASISSTSKNYKELGRSGFTKLAGYIFGGNIDKKQIAMTSPVHMEIGDSASSMSFVMPSIFTKDNLPKPIDAAIQLKNTSEEYVAALSFKGFASNDDILKHIELLKKALKKHHITYIGNFRYLGYNPPYQLFGRKNEIIVTVNWPANKI